MPHSSYSSKPTQQSKTTKPTKFYRQSHESTLDKTEQSNTSVEHPITNRSNHHFHQFPIFHATPPTIQPKLKINAAGDKYEQEADRIADQVTKTSTPAIQRSCAKCKVEDENLIQRQSLTTAITPLVKPVTKPVVQRKCAKCETEEEGMIQTKAFGNINGLASNTLTSQIRNTQGSGQGLDVGTRSFMESRFGTDFTKVKIHTDSQATQMNQELNAKAFTVGSDIYFNQGQYNPASTGGKHLLAHELTHVVQQTNPQKTTHQPLNTPSIQRTPNQRIQKRAAKGLEEIGQATIKIEDAKLWNDIQKTGGKPKGFFEEGTPIKVYKANGKEDRTVYWHTKKGEKVIFVKGKVKQVAKEQYGYILRKNTTWAPKKPKKIRRRRKKPQPSQTTASLIQGLPAYYQTLVSSKEPIASIAAKLLDYFDKHDAFYDPTDIRFITSAVGKSTSVQVFMAFLQQLDAKFNNLSTDREKYKQNIQALQELKVANRQFSRNLGHIQKLGGADFLKRSSTSPLIKAAAATPVALGLEGTILALAEELKKADKALSKVEKITSAFITGFIKGVKAGDNQKLAEQLSDKMAASAVINTLFPPVFLAGAVVGIGTELWETVKGIYELLANWDKIKAELEKLIARVLKDSQVAEELGRLMAQDLKKQLTELANKDVVTFTYELGKLLGPILAAIALSILVPGSGAALKGAKYTGKLSKFVKLAKRFAKRGKKFLGRKGKTRPKLRPKKGRPKLPPKKRRTQLLQSSKGKKKIADLTPDERMAEIQNLRNSISKAYKSKDPKYDYEVKLDNDHIWKKRKDGGWCRFSIGDCSEKDTFDADVQKMLDDIDASVERQRLVDPDSKRQVQQAGRDTKKGVREEGDRPMREIFKDLLRARELYMGPNPKKSNKKFMDGLIKKMRSMGKIRGKAPNLEVKVELPNGKDGWLPVKSSKIQLGHKPEDAVKWWNRKGREYGPQHPEVKKWMKDPKNYELEHKVVNERNGRELAEKGVRYLEPLKK